MDNLRPRKIAAPLLLIALLLLGCDNADTRRAAVGSPQGKLHDKAYSPDGNMYATEAEPKGHGNIGIHVANSNSLSKVVHVQQHPLGDFPNDPKGLAWSPNSKLLAVMYHHDGGGHISVVNVDTGEEIKYLPIDGQPHDVEFSSDGKKLVAGGRTLYVE